MPAPCRNGVIVSDVLRNVIFGGGPLLFFTAVLAFPADPAPLPGSNSRGEGEIGNGRGYAVGTDVAGNGGDGLGGAVTAALPAPELTVATQKRRMFGCILRPLPPSFGAAG